MSAARPPAGARTAGRQAEGRPLIKNALLLRSYRWAVASRVAAAALGGYALTSAGTVLMALLWPAPRAQAVLWATMLSFTVYTAAVIWVFTTRTASRAWLGIGVTTAITAALCAWLKAVGP